MLARLCAYKFATQIQGVPIKFLEAMKFDIPKVSEDRQKIMRAFTSQIQDRLREDELNDFIRDYSIFKEKDYTTTMALKTSIFKLFNQYQMLDLIPYALRIDFKELSIDQFYDDFEKVDSEIKTEYQCFVQNRAAFFQPQSAHLTDFIGYKRKYIKTKNETNQNDPVYTEHIDQSLISTLMPHQETEITNQTFEDQLSLARNARILQKNSKNKEETELKTPLYIKQKEKEEFIQTNKICIYNLPYIIDEKYRQEFQSYIENRFGEIINIEYIEYRNFKKQIDQIKEDVNVEQLKSTQKILERVKVNKNKKLFKSYVLIEFKEQQSKQQILYQDLRIFGLKYKDLILRADDADHKRLLYINNLSKYANVNKFISYLNEQLNTQFEPLDERPQLQNPMVCLIMKSFSESQRAMQILNELTFSRFKMNTYHYPDGLKYVGDKIAEHFNTNVALQVLEQNVQRVRHIVEEKWQEQKQEVIVKQINLPDEEFNLDLFEVVWDEEAQY